MKFLLVLLLVSPSALADVEIKPFKLTDSGPAKNFVYEHDPKALVTSVQISFRAGSLHNPAGKSALAQITFGALLRGTEKKSRQEFVDTLETLGASISVDSGVNRTIIALDAINENLPQAIELLNEAIFSPAFREDDVNILKDEALGLLNLETSNNRALLRRVTRQALYQGTPAALPPQGVPAELAKLTAADMKEFLRSQLFRENVVVAVASNLKKDAVRALLEPSLNQLPSRKLSVPVQVQPRKPKGRVVYLVDRKGSSTTEVAIAQTAMNASFPGRYILDTGLFIFGTEFNSRLSNVLRKENGWTYGAYALYTLLDLPRSFGGSFAIWTFPQTEHTEKAVLKALELLEDYVAKGITQKELAYAKKSLKNSYPFKLANPRDRMSQRIYALNDGAPFYSLEEFRRKIDSVDNKSILATLKKIHDAKNLSVVLVGDLEVTRSLASKIPNVSQVIVVSDPMNFP